MNISKKLLAIMMAALALGACDKVAKEVGAASKKEITCSDTAGLEVITGIVKEGVESSLKNSGYQLSQARSTVGTLGFTIDAVRTAKTDPNSTKVFCEATLTVNVPVETINDVKVSIENSDYFSGDAETVLSNYGFKQSPNAANQFQTEISYNLQPTDNGEHIFGQLEDASYPVDGISELLLWAMSKNQNIQSALEQDRIAAEERAESERLQKEMDADAKAAADAAKAAEKASLAQAKKEYDKAVAYINSIWNSLDEDTREMLRDEQRAINKEREAYCRQESLQAGSSSNEREMWRLQCEVPLMNERAEVLREYY